jgi:general stress protein YciG
MDDKLKQYMSELGKKGGKATGEKKRRPPEHYKRMVEIRRRMKQGKTDDV